MAGDRFGRRRGHRPAVRPRAARPRAAHPRAARPRAAHPRATRPRAAHPWPALHSAWHRAGRSLPWAAILLFTAAFHFYRGAPLDGLFFLAGAVLASTELVPTLSRPRGHNVQPDHGRQRGSGTDHRSSTHWAVWGIVLLIVAWLLLAVMPTGSPGAHVVVAALGIAFVALAWRPPATPIQAQAVKRGHLAKGLTAKRPMAKRATIQRHTQQHVDPGRPPHPAALARAARLWSAVVLFLCLWELGTYFVDRFAPDEETAFPPLSDLLRPLFDAPQLRWLLVGLWLLGCVALLRVGRRA